MSQMAAEKQASATSIEVDGAVAHVILDVPGRSMNVLDIEVVRELIESIEKAADQPGVRGIVLRSGKTSGFCAGADIDQIGSCRDRDEARTLAAAGQEAFSRIGRIPTPVVVAVHGACLGGGLELALACRGLVVADEPKTRVGLPEVQLGIVPGFGGTQRLPRKVGLIRALDLILTGRTLRAKRALQAGVADDCVCPFKLVEEAARYALDLADGKPPRNLKRRRGWKRIFTELAPIRSLIINKAKEAVQKKTRGVFPAPLRAADLIGLALSGDRAAGFKAEAEAVGDLLAGDVSHHLIDLFHRMESLKSQDGGATGFEKGALVGVIGAGVMGADIARLFLKRGASVRLSDVSIEALRKGVEKIKGDFVREEKRRRISRHEVDRTMDRLSYGEGIVGMKRAALTVEAVVEIPDIKEKVFRDLETQTNPSTILLTNTSSIPVNSIADSVERPERVAGLHFFNPVEKMPLIEVVVGERTDPDVVLRSAAIARELGKVPVVVKDSPGFLVNRVLAPYMSEAMLLLEEGFEPFAIDSSMRDLGFPMGPLQVLDTVGLDVAGHVAESLKPFLGDRLGDPKVGRLLVEGGHLGEKSGGGIFVRKGKKKSAAPWLASMVNKCRSSQEVNFVRKTSLDDLRDRLFFLLLDESTRAYSEGLVKDPGHLDAAMILGTGFPPNLGGPLSVIDEMGASVMVSRMGELEERYGARFAAGDDIQKRASAGSRYHS